MQNGNNVFGSIIQEINTGVAKKYKKDKPHGLNSKWQSDATLFPVEGHVYTVVPHHPLGKGDDGKVRLAVEATSDNFTITQDKSGAHLSLTSSPQGDRKLAIKSAKGLAKVNHLEKEYDILKHLNRLAKFAKSATSALKPTSASEQKLVPECSAVLIMDFVEGQRLLSLFDSMKESKQKFTIAEARTLKKNLSEEVSKMHAYGVTHSDLYARNIMVGSHKKVTIIDFGRANQRPTTSNTKDIVSMGLEFREISSLTDYQNNQQAKGADTDLDRMCQKDSKHPPSASQLYSRA